MQKREKLLIYKKTRKKNTMAIFFPYSGSLGNFKIMLLMIMIMGMT